MNWQIETVRHSQRIRICARLVEDVIFQHCRQTSTLGRGNELPSSDLPDTRMLPTRDRFDRHGRPASKSHDRLMLHFEPAVGGSPASTSASSL
jgi:hypothetical protein